MYRCVVLHKLKLDTQFCAQHKGNVEEFSILLRLSRKLSTKNPGVNVAKNTCRRDAMKIIRDLSEKLFISCREYRKIDEYGMSQKDN
jgi:hypothetical protein